MLEADRTAADAEAPRAVAIADRLHEQILSGKYGPGERLPSERELAGRNSVHRSSVPERRSRASRKKAPCRFGAAEARACWRSSKRASACCNTC